MQNEVNKEDQAGGTGHLGRRRFVAATAAGAAAAWVAPTVLSMQAAAAQSIFPVPPDFITSDAAYDGPAIGSSTRMLKPVVGSLATPVAAGDLWLCLIAYSQQGAVINIPANISGVQQSWGPEDSGTGIYSVRTYLIARVLQTSDISGGTYAPPATFRTNNDPSTYGGLRVSAAVYRDPNGAPLALPAVAQGNGTGGVTFPALGSTPPTPNKVVRLGALRGYGGLDVGGPINWVTIPGTVRDNNFLSNHGDRAIAIGDSDNSTGGGMGAAWNYAGATGTDRNWTAWTVAIPAP